MRRSSQSLTPAEILARVLLDKGVITPIFGTNTATDGARGAIVARKEGK